MSFILWLVIIHDGCQVTVEFRLVEVCFSSAGMYVCIGDNVCVLNLACGIGQVNYVFDFL